VAVSAHIAEDAVTMPPTLMARLTRRGWRWNLSLHIGPDAYMVAGMSVLMMVKGYSLQSANRASRPDLPDKFTRRCGRLLMCFGGAIGVAMTFGEPNLLGWSAYFIAWFCREVYIRRVWDE
jgi:hypothetical protein